MVSRLNSGWQILNHLLKLTPKQKHTIQQNIIVRCLADGVKKEQLEIESDEDFLDKYPFDTNRQRRARDSFTDGGFPDSDRNFPRRSHGSDFISDRNFPRRSYGHDFDSDRNFPRRSYGNDFGSNRNFPRQSFGRDFEENRDWLFERKSPSENLRPLEKNFYKESPEVANASEEEVQQFLNEHQITYIGKDIPNPIMKFEDGNFPEKVMQLIRRHQWQAPTPIQSVSWPLALSGRDFIGIAETGSGKTLGFALPGLIHCKAQPAVQGGDGPIALIIVPTRELAQQVELVIRTFGRSMKMRTAAVYGGSPKAIQVRSLSQGAEILVATPGRLNDLLRMGVTNLDNCSYLVLDEADRMLDMGFEPQIRNIVESIRGDRHTLMWSATWPMEIRSLANEFLTDPVRINVGSTGLFANKNIKQMFKVVQDTNDKNREFFEFVHSTVTNQSGKVLVFTATKLMADHLTAQLRRQRLAAASIHSDKSQKMREKMLSDFKRGYFDILVATDVAARGLDVDDITLVINYDCPKNSEDYVHRIGRTARAGKTGTSLTLLEKRSKDCGRVAVQLIKLFQSNNQTPDKELENFVGTAQQAGVGRKSYSYGNQRHNNPDRRRNYLDDSDEDY